MMNIQEFCNRVVPIYLDVDKVPAGCAAISVAVQRNLEKSELYGLFSNGELKKVVVYYDGFFVDIDGACTGQHIVKKMKEIESVEIDKIKAVSLEDIKQMGHSSSFGNEFDDYIDDLLAVFSVIKNIKNSIEMYSCSAYSWGHYAKSYWSIGCSNPDSLELS